VLHVGVATLLVPACCRYWQDKGLVCIVTGRVLNLAALGFTITFSGALPACAISLSPPACLNSWQAEHCLLAPLVVCPNLYVLVPLLTCG